MQRSSRRPRWRRGSQSSSLLGMSEPGRRRAVGGVGRGRSTEARGTRTAGAALVVNQVVQPPNLVLDLFQAVLLEFEGVLVDPLPGPCHRLAHGLEPFRQPDAVSYTHLTL